MSRPARLLIACLILLLALPLAAPVRAQDGGQPLTLLPFENEHLGIRGVVPADWPMARSGGLFVAPARDASLFFQLAEGEPTAITLSQLVFDLGLPDAPARAGIRETAAFTWELYRFEATAQPDTAGPETIRMDVAVTATPRGAALVAMQTTGDIEALHETLFLPVVDAFDLLADGPPGPVTLAPYVNSDLGLRTVAPIGWEEVAPGGIFISEARSADLVLQAAAGAAPGDLAAELAGQFDLADGLEPVEELRAGGHTWTLYSFAGESPAMAGVAIVTTAGVTDTGTGAVMVVLQTLPDDHAALTESVLRPALEALAMVRPAAPAIRLAPFASDELGLSGVAPDGWQEVVAGVFARNQSTADLTTLIQQYVPGASPAAVAAALLPNLGISALPDRAAVVESAAFTWELYVIGLEVAGVEVAVDVALAETGIGEAAGTALVILQMAAGEYGALHEAVFLPAVQALALPEPSGAAAPTVESITLIPYRSEVFQFSSVVPQGWAELAPGIYALSADPPGSFINLVQQAAGDLSREQAAATFLANYGIERLPARVETVESGLLRWDLYVLDLDAPQMRLLVDLAVSTFDGTAYVVLMQATGETYPTLHQDVFLPALNALTPLSEVGMPPYADRDVFFEEEVLFSRPEWVITGTLTRPTDAAGPLPGVVLVAGSGDRDGTLGPNHMLRDLAWGLAARGFVVLRYDTRPYLYESAWERLDRRTIDDAITEDARAAVALLQETADVDPARVFLVGHGLGAMLAPRIAAQAPGAAGVALLAAAARPYGVILAEQAAYLSGLPEFDTQVAGAQLEELGVLAARLTAVHLGEDVSAVFDDPGEASYWASLLAYDPLAAAAALDRPVLVLQGERDYQVTMADFALWEEALAGQAAATLISYPALVHTFMALGDPDRLVTPGDYSQPGFVDAAVIDDLVEWMTGPSSRAAP